LSIFDCPMLPVSRDCPFLIAQCYQCLGIVHFWLPNVTSVSGLSIFGCPMLPVSRDCPFLIAPSVFSDGYLGVPDGGYSRHATMHYIVYKISMFLFQ
jgi:hypothetical protein